MNNEVKREDPQNETNECHLIWGDPQKIIKMWDVKDILVNQL